VLCINWLAEPPQPRRPCEWTNCAYTSSCAHPAAIMSQTCTLMSKHLYNAHTCMHWGPGHLFRTCHNQYEKCTCTRTSTPVRRCSNFFAMQIIATHFATWALPNKPSKSKPAQGAVATVLSHRHHLTICLGAGPIQFVYGWHSKLGHGAYHQKIEIPALFRGLFACS